MLAVKARCNACAIGHKQETAVHMHATQSCNPGLLEYNKSWLLLPETRHCKYTCLLALPAAVGGTHAGAHSTHPA